MALVLNENMSDVNNQARLEAEIMLLEAGYPDQATYNEHARELKFSGDNHSSLSLRIPRDYPDTALPEVLSATGSAKQDLRDALRKRLISLQAGEEVLDVIVNAFLELVESVANATINKSDSSHTQVQQPSAQGSLTVVIWLHHLLATSKRKLAIAPSSTISGITKPGYPGVMLFTGPAAAVRDHVEVLKQENWQAFQIRLEEDELWSLAHGKGVKEVESMGEVVKEVGPVKKDVFLEAMKIK